VTDLQTIRRYLRGVTTRDSNSGSRDPIRADLAAHKAAAVRADDQSLAKEIWCLEQILIVQTRFLEAFAALKAERYYEGWCILEQAQIAQAFLDPHFKDTDDAFKLGSIRAHIEQLQSLFPYRLFFSTEFIHKELTCTICDKVVALRNPCGHRDGEIYNGELCSRKVTDLRILGVSLVRHPRNKYAVGFHSGADGKHVDRYNYAGVKYVVERLQSAFDPWTCIWTTRRVPHTAFRQAGRNAPCPCGSEKKYKKCCLRQAGVLQPHCEVVFGASPERVPERSGVDAEDPAGASM